METKDLEETYIAEGKNASWKERLGGDICKCALQVNDFYMKVCEFSSPHSALTTPESRLLRIRAGGALGDRQWGAGTPSRERCPGATYHH